VSYRSERAVSPTTGETSWVVVNAVTYELHPERTAFAAYLRQRGRAWNTERTYSGRTALYLSYCSTSGVRWAEPTMDQLARFLRWLVDEPLSPRGRVSGREPRFRSKKTANAVLTTTCEFLRFGARQEWVPPEVVARLTREKYLDYLPKGYWAGEDGQFRMIQAREIKFTVVDDGIEWLTPEEVERVVDATTRCRDRFLVGLLWVTGMRIGETLGLRREDVHLLSDSQALGCRVRGPHVHVRRRPNANGAWAKSPVSRTIPVTEQVAGLYVDYVHERDVVALTAPQVWDSDMVFVNLFRAPLGRPMSDSAVKDLFDRLARRAGLVVRPHMVRHSTATAWIRAGSRDRDVVSELLGHQSPASLNVYVHASDADKRAAVDNVAAQAGRP
jgi:integrase/recombinase XerD